MAIRDVDVSAWEPWVRRLAARWHHNDRDDMTQVGLLEVAKLMERFDPDRGLKFATFARTRVIGAMLDARRSETHRGKAPLQIAMPIPEVASPEECEPEEPRRVIVHGKVRWAQRSRCVCGSPFWRRMDTRHERCSRKCRWNQERVCSRCGITFRKFRYTRNGMPTCCRACANKRKP